MRAIILAAGMGTRLRPLTTNTPKSLVEVAGEPMIERQIKFLLEKDISDIIVLTGYLKDKFDYLVDKYNVKLIHNDKYDVFNNVYTMYLVRDYLQDAIVTEADVYMHRNFFKTDLSDSTYFTGIKTKFEDEWILKFDSSNRVNEIIIDSGTGYIMSGVSYWSKDDGRLIRERLEEVVENGDFSSLYWDDIVKQNLNNLNVFISKIKSDDWFEIDSIEDYESVNNYLQQKLITT